MREATMRMRCCAACKRVLRKARLCEHIRRECGWEWYVLPSHVGPAKSGGSQAWLANGKG